MIDAATMQFPYRPPSGYTEEYLDSLEYIHQEMALRLERLRDGRGPLGMYLMGECHSGKTAVMRQLEDIAQRRHGGYPTINLEIKEGQSIFKSMAERMLALLDTRPHSGRVLAELKSAIKAVGVMADRGFDAFYDPKGDIVELVSAMGAAVKEAGLAFVFFIDDVDNLHDVDLASIVHCASWAQRLGLPMMFVISGPEDVFFSFGDLRSDGCFLFTVHDASHNQKSSAHP